MKRRYIHQRDPDQDEHMKSQGSRFVVTRKGLPSVYESTLSEAVDALRASAKSAPAALWRL